MSFKKRKHFDRDVFDLRKIESTIDALKANCIQCANGEQHRCGIQTILHEWEGLKQEWQNKR